jgi:hypothetical protein
MLEKIPEAISTSCGFLWINPQYNVLKAMINTLFRMIIAEVAGPVRGSKGRLIKTGLSRGGTDGITG